ncbi:hypothetical protein MMC25_003141 [Agyrium rufum]|nr:hypothetical protein [Agyrium rufum]
MTEARRPITPTLFPPRKSVELEDPGARDLDSSSDEQDVFADARDSTEVPSAPPSPIPITRVEKVDNEPSHGQVPGTPAYNMRMQDAVPDEVAVIPEGPPRRHTPSRSIDSPLRSPSTPKLMVEKIDPDTPSHGEIPGTVAHKKRKADAVPDVIIKAPPPGKPRASVSEASIPGQSDASETVPVPRMVVTRVDSVPKHGEVPGTKAAEMREMDAEPDEMEIQREPADDHSYFHQTIQRSSMGSASPVAADGGFGPMDYDEDDEDDEEQEGKDDKQDTFEGGYIPPKQHNDSSKVESGFGDDFDEFEEGGAEDDFGDFDEGFQGADDWQENDEPVKSPPRSTAAVVESPFTLLDFTNIHSLSDFISDSKPQLTTLFPDVPQAQDYPQKGTNGDHPLLSSRSSSLYSQLVAPPPLQPPNWVRSRIRRLFLVSLGVPIDLDEILPASKQKKLILPYTSSPTGDQFQSKGGSAVSRLRQDNVANNSTTSLDSGGNSGPEGNTGGVGGANSKSRRGGTKRKGPPPPPADLDISTLRIMCSTTEEALKGMDARELQEHVERLEQSTREAVQLLEYWRGRTKASLADKETFEGVIANLVRFARKSRK